MLNIVDTARVHHATKAKAERLASAFAADYPAMSITPVYNEDESAVTAWAIAHTSIETDEVTPIGEYPKVPELADVLEAADALGVDPEEGFEEGPSGSVVPEAYRAAYKENSSNGQTCGDWLAEFLTEQCHTVDGFSADDFQAILDHNEVDQSGAWARLPMSGQKGWVGRWRMNGRQALEKRVALTGFVRGVAGGRFDLPEDELAHLQDKHSGFLAKLAKAEKKEEAAA